MDITQVTMEQGAAHVHVHTGDNGECFTMTIDLSEEPFHALTEELGFLFEGAIVARMRSIVADWVPESPEASAAPSVRRPCRICDTTDDTAQYGGRWYCPAHVPSDAP